MNHWLVKQEPESYSWDDFVKEGTTAWTGVRNFQARNNLRGMKKGDAVFYYHSGEAREIVGLARVAREAYADPTADEGDWAAVDLTAMKPLAEKVSLGAIKKDPMLKEMQLARNSRLSVSPVTAPQFARVLSLAKTTAKEF